MVALTDSDIVFDWNEDCTVVNYKGVNPMDCHCLTCEYLIIGNCEENAVSACIQEFKISFFVKSVGHQMWSELASIALQR